ncbi:MAG: hypothetical protein ACRDJH_00750 [Thermomicrobiales bacterium]
MMFGLIALALLTMPTDYRGGADVSHAHAVFQFWTASGRSAVNHHNHEHHSERSNHHGIHIVGELWLSETMTVRGDATEIQWSRAAPPDVPILTDVTVTVENSGLLALMLIMSGLIVLGRPSLILGPSLTLSPSFVQPRTPPPK